VIVITIQQIKVGNDNFSYIIYSPATKKAALVDPSFDASKALDFITDNKLTLDFIIVTQYHLDHIYDINRVKENIPRAKVVASELDGEKLDIDIDVSVSDGDHLTVGDIKLSFLLTPGHTAGSICIVVDNQAVLTGDTLFIGDCGRTDLSDGDPIKMFETLHEKIILLPGHLIVYPGHDYGDKPKDTLVHQKHTNKTLLAKIFKEFSQIP
jgi:glyoxylase-like metal-dependent hydrolase (beta-lactamase superfamily II)